MEKMDEFKKQWCAGNSANLEMGLVESSLDEIIRNKVKHENNRIMQYFWASLTYNILVYALSSYVIFKYWQDPSIFTYALLPILATIPFTYFMVKRYKQMAGSISQNKKTNSIHSYIFRQKELLLSFFTFKKRYEWFLIPFNAAIGVLLVFNIYVPGGVNGHLMGAFITFILTLFSCIYAIRIENLKHFKLPLNELQKLLDEFEEAK